MSCINSLWARGSREKKVGGNFYAELGSTGKYTFRQSKFFSILNFAKILPILQNKSCHCFDRKEGRGWDRGKSKEERKTKHMRTDTCSTSQTVQKIFIAYEELQHFRKFGV